MKSGKGIQTFLVVGDEHCTTQCIPPIGSVIQYTHAIRSITDVTDKIYAKHSQYPILESTSVKLTSGRAHDGMPAADSFGLPLLGGLALHLHLARGRGHLVDLGRHLLCQH